MSWALALTEGGGGGSPTPDFRQCRGKRAVGSLEAAHLDGGLEAAHLDGGGTDAPTWLVAGSAGPGMCPADRAALQRSVVLTADPSHRSRLSHRSTIRFDAAGTAGVRPRGHRSADHLVP